MFYYQLLITSILFVLLLIAVWNIYLFRKRILDVPDDSMLPFVSILVPARNEELNIRDCVESLLQQDYPNYEVIILNDSSDDKTSEILDEIKNKNPKLVILQGKPLAEGWTGKTYACKQLAENANGAWLLFTDADTRHKPCSLRGAMNIAIERNSDLLTVFPKMIMKTFSEKLLMPMLFFIAFVLLPFYFVDKKGFTKFAIGVGPFMLFKRSAYEKIGGYDSVKNAIVEDVWLSRKIKEHGLRLAAADGQNLCSVRMYRNFKEIWNGFSKNIFAGFNFSTPVLFTINFLYLILFFLPFVFLLMYATSNYQAGLTLILVFIQVIILYLIRILLTIKFKLGFISTLLHPLGAFMVPVIAFNSWRWIASGKGSKWKGRIYQIKNNSRL
jgi:chlorobactene glucosyltransferase